MEENGKKSVFPTKLNLTGRLLIGVYLVYTAVTLIDSVTANEGNRQIFFGVFVFLFAIAGILLVIHSGYGLLKGRYAGGAMDKAPKEAEGKDTIDKIE